MSGSRHDQVSRPTSTVARDGWNAMQREPRLEELMEDPMMGLLWRLDGLEPSRARETLRKLRAIVQARRETMVEAA